MTRTPDVNHLAALIACVQVGLRNEIINQLRSHPKAQHFDADKTSGGGGSDPTANTATSPDQARHDLEQHDANIDRAYRALLALAALSDRYLPTHEPRRTTIAADTRGCALHERAGVEVHHPAKVTTDFASVLATPLRDPIPVCEACRDYTRRHLATPTAEQILRHERTGRWTQRTDGKRSAVFSVGQIVDEWQGR